MVQVLCQNFFGKASLEGPVGPPYGSLRCTNMTKESQKYLMFIPYIHTLLSITNLYSYGSSLLSIDTKISTKHLRMTSYDVISMPMKISNVHA